jgi:DNA repair exonuclease SbcCD ATPase subunit
MVDGARTVRLARELETADEELAARIAEVDRLQHETAEIRERTTAVQAVLDGLPAAREAASGAVERANRALERRRAAVAKADLELAEAERSRDQEAVAEARRAVVRARDAASSAERKLARAEDAVDTVERDARSAAAEANELERSARRISGRLAGEPRLSPAGSEPPSPGLDGTLEWASKANASLFVVRSGLDTERERIVRQANELAAGALGEPVAATSVALLRARLESALGDAESSRAG